MANSIKRLRILILCSSCVITIYSQAESSVDPNTLQSLIKKLGDDDFDIRSRAENALVDAGENTLRDLEAARNASKDTEIRQRLDSVLARVRWWDWVVWTGKSSVNTRAGEMRWKYHTLNDAWQVESVRVGRDVIVQDNDGKIERRSVKDGRVVWSAGKPDMPSTLNYSGVLCTASRQLFRISRTSLCSFDIDSGKEIWNVKVELPVDDYPRVIASANGVLFFDQTRCDCYDIANGSKRWTFTGGADYAVELPGGDILIAHEKTLARVSAADGKRLWVAQTHDRVNRMSFRVVGSYVIVSGWDPEGKSLIEVFEQGTSRKAFEKQGCFSGAAEGSKNRLFLARGDGVFHGGEIIALNTDGWSVDWTCPYAKMGVDLLPDGDRLFVCEYNPMSCDAALKCLNGVTGQTLWNGEVTGITVGHSEYEQTAHIVRQNNNIVLISKVVASLSRYFEPRQENPVRNGNGIMDGEPVPLSDNNSTIAQYTPAKRFGPWLVSAAIVVTTVGVLRAEGRCWWCACGHPWPWISDIWSQHCSQHLLDPYSFTHVSHGLIFYGLLAWARPRWPMGWRFCAAISSASAWEVLENSPYIIERYRHATMSLNYLGDSVANSLGDMLSCTVGFMLADRLGFRYSLLLFVTMELLLLIWIRDNLMLNILMLLYPLPAIKAWQAAGHAT